MCSASPHHSLATHTGCNGLSRVFCYELLPSQLVLFAHLVPHASRRADGLLQISSKARRGQAASFPLCGN